MSLPLDKPFPARGGEVGLSQRGTVPAQSGVVVHGGCGGGGKTPPERIRLELLD